MLGRDAGPQSILSVPDQPETQPPRGRLARLPPRASVPPLLPAVPTLSGTVCRRGVLLREAWVRTRRRLVLVVPVLCRQQLRLLFTASSEP